MKKLSILLLLVVPIEAQTYFSATRQSALSGAAEVITVQQSATPTRNIHFVSAYFDCSVACTVAIERNGTAATTTAITPAQVNPQLATVATATAYRSSNVGTGTVIDNFNCPSACAFAVDLSKVYFLSTAGTNNNLTVRSSSITGTFTVNIMWGEVAP